MDDAQTQQDGKVNILLVDDNSVNLLALEAVLQPLDYSLVRAHSGPEALAALETREFALVLLDIHMPGMDGYETARRIKESPRTRNIPIIFVTAVYQEDPLVERGYRVGAVDYFGKPFNPEILKMKVGFYADLYRKNAELQKREVEQKRVEMELRALNQSLAHRVAELSTVLDTIPNAACIIGNEGDIRRWNAGALSVFGFEGSDEFPKNMTTFAQAVRMQDPATGEPIPPEEQACFRALRGETAEQSVAIRLPVSGERQTVRLAARPILFEGKIVGAVVTATEQREVEELI